MAAKTTRVTIAKPERTAVPKEIIVPDIETQIAPFYIRSLSPIIINNFSEKSRNQLEAESTGAVTKGKPGGRGKPPRNPEAEFQAARILDKSGHDCFPTRWLKAALVTAAGMPDVALEKKVVRQTVFILGDLIPIETNNGSYATPRMGSDWVRRGKFGSKVPMLAYRAYFDDWALKFEVQFEPKLISPQWLVYLIRRAGLSIGLGEWRPEKNGENGRFDVKLTSAT